MQLDQVDLIDPEPIERTMQAVASAQIAAVARLGRQKEALAMLSHPRRDSQLRISISSRRVDVIDAVFDQEVEDWIGFFLLHCAKRGGAEDQAATLMIGTSECS